MQYSLLLLIFFYVIILLMKKVGGLRVKKSSRGIKMRRRFIFFIAAFMLMMLPNCAQAKAQNAKKCVYSDGSNSVELYIKTDYSASAFVTKNHGTTTESISDALENWGDVKDSVKKDSSMPCPKYAVFKMGTRKFMVWVTKTKDDADKVYNKEKNDKSLVYPPAILDKTSESFINNDNTSGENHASGKQDVAASCTYTLNSDTFGPPMDAISLPISLSPDRKTIVKSMKDGHRDDYANYFSYSTDFDEIFLGEFYNADNNTINDCPTLRVAMSYAGTGYNFNIYPNSDAHNPCNSATESCFDLSGTRYISSESTDSGIAETKYEYCIFGTRAIYLDMTKNSLPAFKKGSDGSVYWTLNEEKIKDPKDIKSWVKIIPDDLRFKSAIQLADKSAKISIAEDLYKSIFGGSKLNCPDKFIVNCNQNTLDQDELIISLEKLKEYQACTDHNSEYSYSSRRESRRNNASLSGLNQNITCSQLFSTEAEGSVLWLIQKLLSYIKIAGPILVILLSAVDFIKAIATSDEEAVKKAQGKLIIRLIAVVALFLVPSIIELALKIISGVSNPTCILE